MVLQAGSAIEVGDELSDESADSLFARGITFEAPRHSLMTAVRYELFDDLLIGNFMKTTLHGDFGEGRLAPKRYSGARLDRRLSLAPQPGLEHEGPKGDE